MLFYFSFIKLSPKNILCFYCQIYYYLRLIRLPKSAAESASWRWRCAATATALSELFICCALSCSLFACVLSRALSLSHRIFLSLSGEKLLKLHKEKWIDVEREAAFVCVLLLLLRCAALLLRRLCKFLHSAATTTTTTSTTRTTTASLQQRLKLKLRLRLTQKLVLCW